MAFNDFIQLWGQVGETLGSFWVQFGVTFVTSWWLWVTLGLFWGQFGFTFDGRVGLVGPKSENVDFLMVLITSMKVRKGHGYSKEKLQPSGRSGWEGVGGG